MKFRRIIWVEGPRKCRRFEKEIEADTIMVALNETKEAVEKLNRESAFAYGLEKLIRIGDSGEETEIPFVL